MAGVSTSGNAFAQSDEAPRNVLTASGSVGVAFPDIGDPPVGIGIGVAYERVLSNDVSVAIGTGVGFVVDDDVVGWSADVGVPIYLVGNAPTGFFLSPELGVGVADEEAAFSAGLSIGYQHVFDSGLVLGVAAGPSVGVDAEFRYDAVFGVGFGVGVGYAF